MKWIILLILQFIPLYSGLFLLNDTPFILTAIIESASGELLNQVNISPGEHNNWTRDTAPTGLDVPETPASSITPYTVIWRCPNGGNFSLCYNVSPGALVRASECSGAHFCKPKEKEQECPSCICPPCPETTEQPTQNKQQESTLPSK